MELLTQIPFETCGCGSSSSRSNGYESAMWALNRGLDMNLVMMCTRKKLDEAVIREKNNRHGRETAYDINISHLMVKPSTKCSGG